MKLKYIPNIISLIRILLVGVFAYVFLSFYPQSIIPAAGVFILSGITDVADGIIARHFGWTTNLGKVIDPIADKLMQCTVLLCLSLKGVTSWWIFVFFMVKEGMMAAGALLLFKKRHEVYGSKFFGKFATVFFYTVIAAIIVWGDKMGAFTVEILCLSTALSAIAALVLYSLSYMKNKKQELPEEKGEIHNQW